MKKKILYYVARKKGNTPIVSKYYITIAYLEAGGFKIYRESLPEEYIYQVIRK